MRFKKISGLVAFLAFIALPGSDAAAQPDANQALIDLLVRKGVLTAQDVASLRQEIEAQVAQPPRASGAPGVSVVPPEPIAPSAATVVPAEAVVAGANPPPLSFKIGAADFTPFGFVDFISVSRSTNVGSGISTNFAGIPYATTSAGQMAETRFSAQNSRIGLRVDSDVMGSKVLGYVETDFLGNAASTLNVTSNAATLRMRLYFADFRKNAWEFLAGQSWSMLTPNRVGISPIPGDLFYTMDTDIAYQAGLVWARQPQVRVVYHASDTMSAGLSVENPDQYVGGVNGAPAVTLPTGFNAAEVDTGAATSSPNRMPDIVGKLALDTTVGGLPWHAEVAGVYRSFEINTYAAGAAPVNRNSTAAGLGGSFNVDFEIVKNLSLVGTAYMSDGGGRYIYGQAPDFVVNPQGASGAFTISPVSADSYIGGLEWKVGPMTTLYAYASEVDIGRRDGIQANGSYVGYGYPGSSNAQNKAIDEYTLGVSQTLWRDRNHGALQIMGQMSYVERMPWFVAAGSPAKADTAMAFVDLRYVFP